MENHIIQSDSFTLKISLRFIILTISQLILFISLVMGKDDSYSQIKAIKIFPIKPDNVASVHPPTASGLLSSGVTRINRPD
jgi:hypothetical protein